jgi:flavin reductase (NADH)/cob(II)yrinic acid a,c-diamide reductase
MGLQPVELDRALALLPAAPWIMSSIYETTRTGVLVRRVVQCADEPVCLCIAVRKGSRIDPIVRDSRVFAVSLMPTSGGDRLLLKKFDTPEATDDDPFDAYRVVRLRTGAPVMSKAVVAFDCEVLSHVDLETDSELYIGRVLEAVVSPGDHPAAGDGQAPM